MVNFSLTNLKNKKLSMQTSQQISTQMMRCHYQRSHWQTVAWNIDNGHPLLFDDQIVSTEKKKAIEFWVTFQLKYCKPWVCYWWNMSLVMVFKCLCNTRAIFEWERCVINQLNKFKRKCVWHFDVDMSTFRSHYFRKLESESLQLLLTMHKELTKMTFVSLQIWV